MTPYLYALGAILCWASLPAAVGSGLAGLSTEEFMFYSFSAAAAYLYLQNVLMTRSLRLYLPGFRASLWGIFGIFGYHYVYYMAMDNASLAEAAILATTWSFWIVVFSSVLVFRKLKGTILLTALMGMVGAGWVISSGKELSFFLWNRALATGNLSIIGFLSYFTPPLAVLLVAFIHGQKVSGQVLLGMGVIITASTLGKVTIGGAENIETEPTEHLKDEARARG